MAHFILGNRLTMDRRGSAVRRPTVRAFGAAASLALCAACASGTGTYQGTGSLAVSGGAMGPLLASHVAVFADCPTSAIRDGTIEAFSVLSLGAGCVMDGYGNGPVFQPDRGTVCALQFADGEHALRVTDVSVQYGVTIVGGRAFSDEGHVLVELGGDDVKTGVHALYSFTGVNLEDPPPRVSCDDERLKHIARMPSAVRLRAAPDDPSNGPPPELSHAQ